MSAAAEPQRRRSVAPNASRSLSSARGSRPRARRAVTGPRPRRGRRRSRGPVGDPGHRAVTRMVARGRVCAVGQDHPCAQAGAQVVQDLGGDPFAGQDRRDARRVRGDLLRRDPADGLVGGHALGAAEERVAGRSTGVHLAGRTGSGRSIRVGRGRPGAARHQSPERGEQPCRCWSSSAIDRVATIRRWSLRPMSTCWCCAQPVGGLVPADAQVLRRRSAPAAGPGRGGLRREQLVLEHVQTRHAVDAGPHLARPDPARRRASRGRAATICRRQPSIAA